MQKNFFEEIPDASMEEVFETILQNKSVKIERITSLGQSTPEGQWLSSDQDEWVMLMRGKAGLEFQKDNKQMDLKAGDYLLIPAGEKHRVTYTDPSQKCLWLTVYH